MKFQVKFWVPEIMWVEARDTDEALCHGDIPNDAEEVTIIDCEASEADGMDLSKADKEEAA